MIEEKDNMTKLGIHTKNRTTIPAATFNIEAEITIILENLYVKSEITLAQFLGLKKGVLPK